MKVRFTETALEEIDELFAYIAERNPHAADLLVERAWQKIAALADFPDSAPMTDKTGVRSRTIGHYPYLIFYSVEGAEVVVLHVRHAARRRPWEQES